MTRDVPADPGSTRPEPVDRLVALDALRRSDDVVVRRAAADALADVARNHPTLALSTAQRWLAEGGRDTASVVRRGLRPLVDRRDETALRLCGFAPEVAVRVKDLDIGTAERGPAHFGDLLAVRARLASAETRVVPVLAEVTIEHCSDRGSVVVARHQLLRRELAPLSDLEVGRTVRLPAAATPRWQPGDYAVTVVLNGRRDATTRFTLTT